ncbi:MAG: nucleotidyltransferase family protein [Gemmatimonadaceae bacterium]
MRSLSPFGSVARGEEGRESDIDLLVGFTRPPGFDGYMDLKFFLEDLLGARVDLVMEDALRPDARPFVDEAAVRVA